MPTPRSHDDGELKPDATFRVAGPSEHAGASTFCLKGEFDLAGVPLFDHALRATPGATRVIIDLRELDFIDSSGIAALFRASHRLREAGGGLQCIVAAEGLVRRVIEMTHLAEVFDVREEPRA
jgi:anti-sigma B factor antagonist